MKSMDETRSWPCDSPCAEMMNAEKIRSGPCDGRRAETILALLWWFLKRLLNIPVTGPRRGEANISRSICSGWWYVFMYSA